MIYFIGGLKHREFKYFKILERLREETPNILETVFDASLKEELKKHPHIAEILAKKA